MVSIFEDTSQFENEYICRKSKVKKQAFIWALLRIDSRQYMHNEVYGDSRGSDLSGSACDCQTHASNMQYVLILLLLSNTDNYIGPSNARRVPQSSTAISIGSILIADPCLPSSFQISSINSADQSTAASTHAGPESFFGWLHNIWNKIRNAIKNISIKITIPWNVLEDWLNKIAKGWAVQQDPNDNQTVLI